VVYHDITEQRQIERQLWQAQKLEAIGQLTGGIAHDFNNILTVITGTIDILARAVAHDAMLSSITRMIDEAADRGSQLTRRLLAFARKQPLQPRPTDINLLVVETTQLLRPTLGEQIEIETLLEGDTWPAQIDPSQLAAALINLALNARDAMPGGGRITMQTGNVYLDRTYVQMNVGARPGPYVMVAVRDNGSGIPVAIRDKVFEPFFTTKETGKGTGLGLSMVYGFVKQSGGHIKIVSQEGNGTSINLYLPRANELVEVRDDIVPVLPLEGGDETILVVEDDPLVRAFVTAQLQSLGYRTIAADDGPAALTEIDRHPDIDLLFTDVIMPGGLNGRQLADEAMRRRPDIRVLFTSGYPEDIIVHHGRLDDGVHLLGKPYRKADLARMIRVVLGSRATSASGEAA
jgi:nitrogen-specific signal transduction histidine kinase